MKTIKIKEITSCIEAIAPLAWQESYDNSGFILGEPENKAEKVLICLDISEEIILEAIDWGANLIISHHPPIFGGLKKINPEKGIGKCLALSIKHQIAWYAAHTNLDNAPEGVNFAFAEILGLKNVKPLKAMDFPYKKIQTFVPPSHKAILEAALFEAGCGSYHQYEHCGFSVEGQGSFTPIKQARPFIGKIGQEESLKEYKWEGIYPIHKEAAVLSAFYQAHPYEEPSFDLLNLSQKSHRHGSGIVGEFENPIPEKNLLKLIKEICGTPCLRHSGFKNRSIKKLAFCGGSGAFLIADALACQADVFLTGEIKYHDFCEQSSRLWLIEGGHFETEKHTKEIIYKHITKKFPNFAVKISEKEKGVVFYE